MGSGQIFRGTKGMEGQVSAWCPFALSENIPPAMVLPAACMLLLSMFGIKDISSRKTVHITGKKALTGQKV